MSKSPELFNPKNPEYETTKDLPQEERGEFVDLPEESGFIRKEVMVNDARWKQLADEKNERRNLIIKLLGIDKQNHYSVMQEEAIADNETWKNEKEFFDSLDGIIEKNKQDFSRFRDLTEKGNKAMDGVFDEDRLNKSFEAFLSDLKEKHANWTELLKNIDDELIFLNGERTSTTGQKFSELSEKILKLEQQLNKVRFDISTAEYWVEMPEDEALALYAQNLSDKAKARKNERSESRRRNYEVYSKDRKERPEDRPSSYLSEEDYEEYGTLDKEMREIIKKASNLLKGEFAKKTDMSPYEFSFKYGDQENDNVLFVELETHNRNAVRNQSSTDITGEIEFYYDNDYDSGDNNGKRKSGSVRKLEYKTKEIADKIYEFVELAKTVEHQLPRSISKSEVLTCSCCGHLRFSGVVHKNKSEIKV